MKDIKIYLNESLSVNTPINEGSDKEIYFNNDYPQKVQ